MKVELQCGVERSKSTAATNGYLTDVLVHGMRCQPGDRCSGRRSQPAACCQLAHKSIRNRVGDVQIGNIATIRVQVARLELSAEKANYALSKVEERADARVRLPVVVAEEALIVAP